MNRLAWLFLIAVPACPTTAPPDAAPAPDATPVAVCAALARVGCPEGSPDAGCEATVAKIQATHLVDICEQCVTRAVSRDDVHACRNAKGGPCAIECRP